MYSFSKILHQQTTNISKAKYKNKDLLNICVIRNILIMNNLKICHISRENERCTSEQSTFVIILNAQILLLTEFVASRHHTGITTLQWEYIRAWCAFVRIPRTVDIQRIRPGKYSIRFTYG